MANEVAKEPAQLRQITLRRIVMDPAMWMVVGFCLESMRRLLKPYADAEIRVPLALVGWVLTTAGLIRLVTASKRAVPSQFKLYISGIGVGLMGGLGIGVEWASRFTTLPSYAGFAGLGLIVVAYVLALRDRWTAEADPQLVANSHQQKDD